MGYLIIGAILGYVFSDVITANVPSVSQFKVFPGPTAVTKSVQTQALTQPTWQQSIQKLFNEEVN